MSECIHCGGTGYEYGSEAAHHPECDGSCELCPIEIEVAVDCSWCKGSGKADE